MKNLQKKLLCAAMGMAAILLTNGLVGCTHKDDNNDPEWLASVPELGRAPELEPGSGADFPVSKGAYKRVIIIGEDGAGAFFKDTPTPCSDAIFADGATTYKMVAQSPTISAQNWGSMLHGVTPEYHGLTNSIAASRAYDPLSPYPSIFRVIRENMPEAELASFCAWSAINIGIIENSFGVVKVNVSDVDLPAALAEYLDEGHAPTLLFIHFVNTDSAGHSYGYGTTGHLASITATDALIGQVYESLKAKGLLEDALLILTADHGGQADGHHGRDTDAERLVFLGASGKTVDHETGIIDVEARDIAAISAYALGLECPETWTGRVPTGLFQGITASERKQ